jgi:uncharacterized protein YodC (DUF2158 family)
MLLEFRSKLVSFFQLSTHPKSKFKVGEMVVHEDIVDPLVIKQIVRSLKQSDPLLYCQWFDKSSQETRAKLLHESKLKPLDWDKVARIT